MALSQAPYEAPGPPRCRTVCLFTSQLTSTKLRYCLVTGEQLAQGHTRTRSSREWTCDLQLQVQLPAMRPPHHVIRNLTLSPCDELRRVADISSRQRLRSSSTSAPIITPTRLLANGRFLLLLHASGTVCYFTSLRHHLYRLSEEETESVFVQPQLPVLICCSSTAVSLLSA